MPIAILYGSDGGVLRAIDIDSSGHLQVDALTLPSGLATESSLQKLVNALASVATDKLRASIIDSALPSGAATSANQLTEITALQLIDDLRNALASVATDTLRANIIAALPAGSANIGDVDVVSSALPTGAATAANQATEITALQLIDDLRNALTSVATDSLRAILLAGTAEIGMVQARNYGWDGAAWRKNNLIFGYYDTYDEVLSNTAATVGTNYLTSSAVPAGQIYVVRAMLAKNTVTANTRTELQKYAGAVEYIVKQQLSPAIGFGVEFSGWITLKPTQQVRAMFVGCVAGDDIYLHITGYKMQITQ